MLGAGRKQGVRGSLRNVVIASALGLMLPGSLFCGVVVYRYIASEEQKQEALSRAFLDEATESLGRLVADQVKLLTVLAASHAIDTGDLADLERHARDLPTDRAVEIILRDAAGPVLMSTRLPPGGYGFLAAAEARVVLETGRPHVSDMVPLGTPGDFVVLVDVPVLRDGRLVSVLTAVLRPPLLTEVFARSDFGERRSGAVSDRRGRVIAVSPRSSLTPGGMLPGFAERTGAAGTWLGTGAVNGPVRVQYRRMAETGWVVNFAMHEADYRALLDRAIGSLVALAAGLAGLGAVIAALVLRRMRAARRAADLAASGLAEQERRYRALAEALPQMIWILSEATGAVVYANRHCAPPTDGTWRPGAHPEDDAEVVRSWHSALREAGPQALRCRLRTRDGAFRWHLLSLMPLGEGAAGREWLATALDLDDLVSARQHLEQTTKLLRLAQDAAGAAMWDWDIGACDARLSPQSARLHGIPVPSDAPDAPVAITLPQWEARVWPQDLPVIWTAIRRSLDENRAFSADFRVHCPDEPAGHRWIQALGRAVLDERTGQPVRFVGLHLDVTTRRLAEEALRAREARLALSEERLALALESGQDGVWDWSLPGGEVWVSDHWRAALGGPRIRGVVRRIADRQDRAGALAALRRHLRGETEGLECEVRLHGPDGAPLWVLVRGRIAQSSAQGRPERIVGTLMDVSQRRRAEQRIAHMLHHDELTGLPNRVSFRERLAAEILAAEVRAVTREPGRARAVLACDLDRFKAVNDALGHPVGDRLIRAVAERIRGAVREADLVARLGGDEFAVILTDLSGEEEAAGLAGRVVRAVGEPIDLGGIAVDVGVSVGVAMLPQDGTPADEVFKRADMALYEAKAAGRDTFRVFDAGAQARATRRSQLALDMKDAIRRGDFSLVYQPVIDVTTDRVTSFEALMRWHHPVRGPVSPGDFIPVAEETSLIVPLGAWALREACREAATWPDHLRVAVNVSALQFRAGLEEAVIQALALSGLPPHRLKLEVTESILMADSEHALATLHRLRALGLRIALDDFGTGYSSLSYLRRFPFDKIKIDRSFISDIHDPDAAAIVRAIVGIGERLGMGITAEGVETQDQLARIRQEGCTEVQGFLFSRPLPPDEARRFAERDGARAGLHGQPARRAAG